MYRELNDTGNSFPTGLIIDTGSIIYKFFVLFLKVIIFL